jgi:predicted lipoprotein with Yx(FWY)xxD motif
MKSQRLVASLAALVTGAALLLTATPARADDGVKVASKEGVGKFLTDGKGMTLYVFKKDAPGTSNCAGECLAKWPAFAGQGGEGVDRKDLGSITRADGAKQTTYKGLPLYYFVADKAAGDTKGQGMKDVWSVAAP